MREVREMELNNPVVVESVESRSSDEGQTVNNDYWCPECEQWMPTPVGRTDSWCSDECKTRYEDAVTHMERVKRYGHLTKAADYINAEGGGEGQEWSMQGGLTKREHFAGLALQGIMASDTSHEVLNPTAASWAVQLADALIKALNKEAK